MKGERSAKAFALPLKAFALHRIVARRVPGRSAKALAERLAIALGLAICAVGPFAAQAPPKTPTACDALGALKLPDTTITAAVSVDAGAFRAPGASASASAMNTPAFCRVAATLTPTPESHIKIEVWLPPTTGMGHCSGGTSPNRFDALAALEPWVEKGAAPEKMIASQISQGATVRTRPLCVYPQVAKWNGTGSADEAANFTRRQP